MKFVLIALLASAAVLPLHSSPFSVHNGTLFASGEGGEALTHPVNVTARTEGPGRWGWLEIDFEVNQSGFAVFEYGFIAWLDEVQFFRKQSGAIMSLSLQDKDVVVLPLWLGGDFTLDTVSWGTSGPYCNSMGCQNGYVLSDATFRLTAYEFGSSVNDRGPQVQIVIPEPGTLALFPLGLAALSVARRFRHRT